MQSSSGKTGQMFSFFKRKSFKNYSLKHVGKHGDCTPVSGRFKSSWEAGHFAQNWVRITKDRRILDTIKGYKLELHSMHHQAHEPHPSIFSKEQQLLVETEVQKLKGKEVVVRLKSVPKDGFISSLFLVPKKDGGQRPVINLKCLNKFVVSPHFGILTFKSLVKQDDCLVDQGGPEGHLLLGPDPSRSQKIPVLLTGNKVLSVHLSPFRPYTSAL